MWSYKWILVLYFSLIMSLKKRLSWNGSSWSEQHPTLSVHTTTCVRNGATCLGDSTTRMEQGATWAEHGTTSVGQDTTRMGQGATCTGCGYNRIKWYITIETHDNKRLKYETK